MKDVDGTTNLENVEVTAYNSRTGEWIKESGRVLTNAAGEYTLDAANFVVNGWVTGDVLYVIFTKTGATDQNGVAGVRKYMEYRVTISGASGTRNANMHWGEAFLGNTHVRAVSAANHTATAGRVDIYERNGDSKRISLEVPANNTTPYDNHSDDGIWFRGGCAVIYSSDTITSSLPDFEVTVKTNDTK